MKEEILMHECPILMITKRLPEPPAGTNSSFTGTPTQQLSAQPGLTSPWLLITVTKEDCVKIADVTMLMFAFKASLFLCFSNGPILIPTAMCCSSQGGISLGSTSFLLHSFLQMESKPNQILPLAHRRQVTGVMVSQDCGEGGSRAEMLGVSAAPSHLS